MADTKHGIKYATIYWKVHDLYEKLKRNQKSISHEDFALNLQQQQDHFFAALQRRVVEGASLADKQAVDSHSMWFYNGVNWP